MAATNRRNLNLRSALGASIARLLWLHRPIGRLQVLRIHTSKITLAPEFDLDRAARITQGSPAPTWPTL